MSLFKQKEISFDLFKDTPKKKVSSPFKKIVELLLFSLLFMQLGSLLITYGEVNSYVDENWTKVTESSLAYNEFNKAIVSGDQNQIVNSFIKMKNKGSVMGDSVAMSIIFDIMKPSEDGKKYKIDDATKTQLIAIHKSDPTPGLISANYRVSKFKNCYYTVGCIIMKDIAKQEYSSQRSLLSIFKRQGEYIGINYKLPELK